MAQYPEMILNGHGGWNLRQKPAWAQVPRGTTIKFLTDNLRLLRLPDIDSEETAEALLNQFRAASPSQEGKEYSYVPNYTLSPSGGEDEPDWVYKVSRDAPLCDNDGSDPRIVCDSGIHRCSGIFADEDVVGGVLYWAACRYVQLKEAGDLVWAASTGVNQGSTAGLADPEGMGWELSTSWMRDFMARVTDMGEADATAYMEEQLTRAQAELTPEQLQMLRRRMETVLTQMEAEQTATQSESDESESDESESDDDSGYSSDGYDSDGYDSDEYESDEEQDEARQ
jgi:Putative adhesin Stv domain